MWFKKMKIYYLYVVCLLLKRILFLINLLFSLFPV